MKSALMLTALLTAGPLFADVVINEIHYNPDPGADTSYEFFELHNSAASPVDISSWQMTAGVVHTFAAGTILPADGFLVVAKLASTYTGPEFNLGNVVQWTSGDLNNSGETLSLSNASAQLVDTVPYDDGGCWSLDPDGQGPSLELLNPLLDNSLCSSWTASLVDYGTPGGPNSVYEGAGSAPQISGVSHSPASPSFTDIVTVSATISDDGLVMSALLEVQVDGGASQLLPMTLQSGSLYTGQIPAQAAGSLVSYRVSAEDDETEVTLSDWQSYSVAAGTVEIVINELHYNGPESGTDVTEFVELYNNGTATVELAGWTLSGVTFTFPAGASLAPGEYLVVAVNSAQFLAFYGFAPDFQWTSGALSNDGEAIVLSNGAAQEMDRVLYDDVAPWPSSPDGTGPSLELLSPELDNSLAGSWQASYVDGGTPGALNSTPPVVEARELASSLSLAPAWPNPFNPSTRLSFTLPEIRSVRLSIHDVAGREVACLLDGPASAGLHQLDFQAGGMASGIYFARLESAGELSCQRLLLLK